MSFRPALPGGTLTLLLAAGVAVINLGIFRGSDSLGSYFDLQKSRDVLSQTVAGLKKENTELTSEIDRIRNSPSYAKKVLRDKYHVTEPGEDIIFFAE